MTAISPQTSFLSLQRSLNEATGEVSKSLERLSTGLRINRASDDAAGLILSEQLSLKSRLFTQSVRNLNDGISYFAIAEGALDSLVSINARMQELAEQAATGTVSTRQRGALNQEAQALALEYNRIIQTTSFNGLTVFNGTNSSVQLQAGTSADGYLAVNLGGARGSGTYTSGTSTTGLGTSNQLAAGDLNGDGIPDAVVASTAGLQVLLGSSDGSFTVATSLAFGAAFTSLADAILGDVNGDGLMDVVVGGIQTGTGAVVSYINQGNGTFSLGGSFTTAAATTFFFDVGDVTGDGLADVVTGSTTDALSYFASSGSGTFGSRVTVSTNGVVGGVRVTDLGNDGTMDIMALGMFDPDSGTFGDDILVAQSFLNSGSGSFNLAYTQLVDSGSVGVVRANGMVMADFNNDGYADILYSGGNGTTTPNVTSMLFGTASGAFQTRITSGLPTLSSGTVRIAVGDLNGDGNLDLHVSGAFLAGQGNGLFATATALSSLTTERFIIDMNGDGVADVVGINSTGSIRTEIQRSTSGLSGLQQFSLSSAAHALQALSVFRTVSQNLSQQAGQMGAMASRLDIASQLSSVFSEQYAAGASQIRDADIGVESANLVRAQILQQASVSLLSHQGDYSNLLLSLLKETGGFGQAA